MKILGIDFETEGLLPEKHKITEVGMCLYDTDAKAPVRISGFLVKGALDDCGNFTHYRHYARYDRHLRRVP